MRNRCVIDVLVAFCVASYQINHNYSHMWITPVSTPKFHTEILTFKLGWNCAKFGGMKNFISENFRPEIFTPSQAWNSSHLNRPENFHTWNRPEHFIPEHWIYLLTHVPSKKFPRGVQPLLFHTYFTLKINLTQSNQYISLTNVWSCVEVHNILAYAFALSSKCILISSLLVHYNLILHVVFTMLTHFTIK